MKKTTVICGDYEKYKKAVELLSQTVMDFTNSYPVLTKCSGRVNAEIKIYIGTKTDNEYIRENSDKILTHREEYAISVKNNTVVIEGSDTSGVLYGCADFYNKYLSDCEYLLNFHVIPINPFENDLPDFEYSSYPRIKNRGIWTWGHVIYDYRSFIDNMVRLKMNSVVIWNDFVPVNAKEIVEYAHTSGIKVIWGYSWFWDTDCSKIDINAVCDGIDDLLKQYEEEYLPVGGDGIYFQTFTETDTEKVNGFLIADAATKFVNKASAKFLEKYPELELQFGLHAASVKNKLKYIKKVDSRVRIVWENCGAFPFTYIPSITDGFDETMRFIGEITSLRGFDDRFGIVTKGLTNLDWSKFEHAAGPMHIGTSSKQMRKKRTSEKTKIWRYLQSCWMTNAGYVRDTIKLTADKKDGDMFALALIEDGMFEEKIMFPTALCAELFWNSNEDINKIINEVSLRNYVEFA